MQHPHFFVIVIVIHVFSTRWVPLEWYGCSYLHPTTTTTLVFHRNTTTTTSTCSNADDVATHLPYTAAHDEWVYATTVHAYDLNAVWDGCSELRTTAFHHADHHATNHDPAAPFSTCSVPTALPSTQVQEIPQEKVFLMGWVVSFRHLLLVCFVCSCFSHKLFLICTDLQCCYCPLSVFSTSSNSRPSCWYGE